jgi:Kef-type K+ transport system membrane component KefB
LVGLAAILAAAKLGGDLAERAGQPPVLGELVAGIVVGNLGLPWLRDLGHEALLVQLGQLGVVLLLFEVGLESTVGDMLAVGGRSLLVATLGVIAPWVLGWGVAALVLPDANPYVHVFLGATLTATSVGITARVFKDLGHSQSAEARVILGAAVIDDVMGLVILAALSSLSRPDAVATWPALLLITGKALGFLCGALVLGILLSPWLLSGAARLRGKQVLLAVGLVICFLSAAAANAVGLAPIVGAYAAGLVLEDVHARRFHERGERRLGELVSPVSGFLVPVFFVLMGLQVDLGALARPGLALLAVLLIGAAVLGKQASALGALGSSLDRLTVGIGMIPRGEVGLIFANLGLGLVVQGAPLIDAGTYAAVVLVIVATTLLTPPALAWSIRRARRSGASTTEALAAPAAAES